MGLACLFSTPNSSPLFSRLTNAFVIFSPLGLIQMGEKGQERTLLARILLTKILGNLQKEVAVVAF